MQKPERLLSGPDAPVQRDDPDIFDQKPPEREIIVPACIAHCEGDKPQALLQRKNPVPYANARAFPDKDNLPKQKIPSPDAGTARA
jgi:hypothetical protein